MTRPRRPHGVVYGLLAASLAINLIGLGYLAAIGFGTERSKPPKTVERTIDYVAARYPHPVSDAVRKRLEARRTELKDALAEMRDARRSARRAMSDEPYDRERVAAAFANSRDKAEKFQSVVHGAIVDALPDVPGRARVGIDGNRPD